MTAADRIALIREIAARVARRFPRTCLGNGSFVGVGPAPGVAADIVCFIDSIADGEEHAERMRALPRVSAIAAPSKKRAKGGR